MLIDIKKIHPTPYRDFDLYPFEEEQIENLMLSFADNGDFGILPARPNGTPGTYQIACGHHRIEAMRRLGFSMADLKVGDRTASISEEDREWIDAPAVGKEIL
jgi:ParB-like chromosome segregation protein Spo0J